MSSEVSRIETLRAGAERARIELPEELFPTEGFAGVQDMLNARVLLLESGNKVMLVSIELTSLPEEVIAALQKAVGDMVDWVMLRWLVFARSFAAGQDYTTKSSRRFPKRWF